METTFHLPDLAMTAESVFFLPALHSSLFASFYLFDEHHQA